MTAIRGRHFRSNVLRRATRSSSPGSPRVLPVLARECLLDQAHRRVRLPRRDDRPRGGERRNALLRRDGRLSLLRYRLEELLPLDRQRLAALESEADHPSLVRASHYAKCLPFRLALRLLVE